MSWVNTADSLPKVEQGVLCRLQHCASKTVVEHRLIRVEESDCSWRTEDGASEISFDWDVVQWWNVDSTSDSASAHR